MLETLPKAVDPTQLPFGGRKGTGALPPADDRDEVKDLHALGRMEASPAGLPAIDRVVVLNDLSVARGGGTALALLSVKLFRGLGLPVTYICGDDGDNRELASLGVEIVPLGGQHILKSGRVQAMVKGINNQAAKVALEDWIAANDTARTIYHVHGWSKIMSPAIFAGLRRVSTRTILHAHDFFLACPNGAFYDYQRHAPCSRTPLSVFCVTCNCDKRSYGQKVWRTGRSARVRSILLHRNAAAPRVLLLHEKMAPAFKRAGYPPAELHTLRNPVIPYRGERVRAENNSLFFFIGRLEPEKGIEDAVQAAADAGVPLIVIGDGPLREKLSRQGPNVQILGWRSHSEIAERISDARALLMPTRYPEPFGLVAAEASQSGVPVLLSDKAYLADEMVAAGVALSCDTSDRSAFARTLRQFADMPAGRLRAMSERAFNREACLSTSPENWRDALLAHYTHLVARA